MLSTTQDSIEFFLPSAHIFLPSIHRNLACSVKSLLRTSQEASSRNFLGFNWNCSREALLSFSETRFYWRNPTGPSVCPCQRRANKSKMWRRRANKHLVWSLLKICVCMRCQLHSDKAHRLTFFYRHIRACCAALCRHQLTSSKSIDVFYNTSIMIWRRECSKKPITKNPWKCSPQRATNVLSPKKSTLSKRLIQPPWRNSFWRNQSCQVRCATVASIARTNSLVPLCQLGG